MRWFGGYEMVMAVGAMLQAAELGMVILVDGFIMTNCMLAASKLYPEVLNYAVFCAPGRRVGTRPVAGCDGSETAARPRPASGRGNRRRVRLSDRRIGRADARRNGFARRRRRYQIFLEEGVRAAMSAGDCSGTFRTKFRPRF